MNFTPKTEAELAAANLLPEGRYPFQIAEAEDAKSKKGNDMIKAKVSVYDSANRCYHVYDYLMEAMAFKLRHFCFATGLSRQYVAGTLSAQDCIGREGYCEIEIDDKDKTYPAKNVITDYCNKAGETEAAPVAPQEPKQQSQQTDAQQDMSDIPF